MNAKAEPIARNFLGPVCVAAAVVMAAALYLFLYAPAVTRGVEAGAYGEAGLQVSVLRRHILLYAGAYLLLVAGLCSAVLYRRTAATSRVPWTEATIVTAGTLAVLGSYAGHEFARVTWGIVPTWSDPKLAIATVTAWTLLLVGSAIAIWARSRLTPHRRDAVLAIVASAALGLSAVSWLLGLFTRGLHPAPLSLW